MGQPYCLPGILPALVGHRDSCPFDRIFYQHVFVVYFRPLTAVAGPAKAKQSIKFIIGNSTQTNYSKYKVGSKYIVYLTVYISGIKTGV